MSMPNPDIAALRSRAARLISEAEAAEALGDAAALRAQVEEIMVEARAAWGRPDQDGYAIQQRAQAIEDKAVAIEGAPRLREAAAMCLAEAAALEAVDATA